MQVKILKDCKWSHGGRISTYKTGQIIEIDTKNAEQMIKHEFAVAYHEESKMFKHDQIEDKMMHVEIEDKAMKSAKKSKKSKEVEDDL